MADNVVLNPGAAGATLATDDYIDESGVLAQHQRVKLQIGADGSGSDLSSSNPMPVTGPLTDTQLRATAVPVSAASLPLPSGAATEATLSTRAADATLTGGTAKTIVRGGAKGVTAAADATSTAEGTDHQALDVQIMHGGAAKDPTAIRALTSADVVTVTGGAGQTADVKVTLDSEAIAISGTVPISAAALPLPTGAATETTLSALNTKVTACNTGAVVVTSGSITADTELTTADLDTGAGTDTRAVVGIVGAKSGGAQLIPGDATAGLKVDLGADNDVTITSGTVTTITNVVHVDDNANSLTVDAPNTAPVAVRLSDGTGWAAGLSTIATDWGDGTLQNVRNNGPATTGFACVLVAGNAGHGIVDNVTAPTEDSPVKIGGKASSTVPAAVTTGYRANAYFDLNGRLIVHDDQAIPAGTNAIGKLAANSGVDIGDVDVVSLPALPTGTNTIGNVIIVSGATGGATPYKLISAATTNATSVKASAGKLIGYYLSNVNAAVRHVKFYNKASAPTVGTDTPVLSLMIPAGGAANLDSASGIDFSTGIAFATTTGAADSDTGAVAANEIIVNLWYK